MNDFWDSPTVGETINKEANYIIAIDESGSCSYALNLSKKIRNREDFVVDENRRYFTLCAVVFRKNDYISTQKLISNLKNKYWKNGNYNYRGIDKNVCFHTSEINSRKECFSDKVINYDNFISDLSDTLGKIDAKVVSITFDLYEAALNGLENEVYELAMDSILEKFIYMSSNNSKGAFYFESRGKKEDIQLLQHIKRIVKADGLKTISPKELDSRVCGVYFNPKWANDKHSYIGLEIADLFAYPIHRFMKTGVRGKDFEIVEQKIYGYPNRIKFGLLSYPPKK